MNSLLFGVAVVVVVVVVVVVAMLLLVAIKIFISNAATTNFIHLFSSQAAF